MKTTLDLPEEIIREVKLRAASQRRTVADLVTELLRQGLGMHASPREVSPAGERVMTGDDGLPLIQCDADAPAAQMSPEALLALEHDAWTEEDLRRAGLSL